jgi:hypothetical protein
MLRDLASVSWREIECASFDLGEDLRRFWSSVELLVRMSECAYRVAGAVLEFDGDHGACGAMREELVVYFLFCLGGCLGESILDRLCFRSDVIRYIILARILGGPSVEDRVNRCSARRCDCMYPCNSRDGLSCGTRTWRRFRVMDQRIRWLRKVRHVRCSWCVASVDHRGSDDGQR